ncbi:MAG: HNH endonuclease [Burkholderiales bacterium]|nr:HNH endonuclease [Burkholderiales bacterium]
MVRLILVDGDQIAPSEAAEKSSKVRARGLDPAPWYVHEFDGTTGDFMIVRELERPIQYEDSAVESDDPAEDPVFQTAISGLDDTERDALIKARVGQGPFRDALIERWKGCSVTGCAFTDVLIASHIKPWSKCETRSERVGVENGLLLIPNLDKLFDKGLISFDDNFRILFSPKLKDGFAQMLNVDRHMRLKSNAHEDIRPFLEWHRQNVFQLQ